jgi:hypothetical protein
LGAIFPGSQICSDESWFYFMSLIIFLNPVK